jgi:hypothetical protein
MLILRNCRVAFVLFAVALATPAAAGQFLIGKDALRQLRAPVAEGETLQFSGVEIDGTPRILDLEAFEIYAPDAIIEAAGPGGIIRRLEIPAIRFFRGTISGEVDSMVFIAVDDSVAGVIFSEGRKFRIGSKARPRGIPRADESAGFDVFLEEFPLGEELSWGEQPWTCAVDDFPLKRVAREPWNAAPTISSVTGESLASSTARYALNLAVEGDYELFVRQGANTANYLASLTAATSVIYQRDLKTELKIAYQLHHESSADPFTMVPDPTDGDPSMLDVLVEFGARWHFSAPSSATRSAAMLVSGKNYPAGIAWVDRICSGDFPYPTPNVPSGYGGSYGVLMDAGKPTNFDPDANPNYLAATSTSDFSYWPVLAFAHELGHVIESDHSHCIPLTASEEVTFGRAYVDQCYSGEPKCYDDGSGKSGATGQVPVEKGTIMSYCHLNSGLGTDTRFTFGKSTEGSHHVLDRMSAQLESVTPSISSGISAPSSATIGASISASVSLGSNLTYRWEVINGGIDSGGTGSTGGGGGTATVNLTATADPVTVRIFATNAIGCSATDFATIAVTPSTAAGTKGDSNGDGRADIFWRHSSGLNAWWFMNGVSLSSSAFTSSLDSTWSLGGAGDFDGNGTTDLVWRHSSGLNAVWLMAGEVITASAFVPSLDPSWELAAIADFNGDGKADMFWRHEAGALNAIWFMNGTSIGSSAYTTSLDSSWTLLAAEDFGGDGKADLVWKHTSGAIAAWNMNGAAIESGAYLPSLDSSWVLEVAGDFDGDGRSDLLWRHESGLNAIWFMNGASVSSSAFTAELPLTWSLLASGDYDGNGRADLFWRLNSGLTAVWLMDGNLISSSGFTPTLDGTWNTSPDPATGAKH